MIWAMPQLLVHQIGGDVPFYKKGFSPERLPLIVFFCSLWEPTDTPKTISAKTGMSLTTVHTEIVRLRGYLGIAPNGRRRSHYVLAFAFLQLHAPEEVQGLPVPDPDLAPAPTRRGPKKTISESFGTYLRDLRAKESLDYQRQNQSGHQR